MYNYIDLTVEAYEEYFETSFSGGIVLQNSIMDTHFSTAEREIERKRERERERGRGRPKSEGCRCEERGHQNVPLCRDRKLMTPKWNY